MLLWGEPPPRPLIVTVRVQEQALLRTPDFHRRAPTKGEGRSESSRSITSAEFSHFSEGVPRSLP